MKTHCPKCQELTPAEIGKKTYCKQCGHIFTAQIPEPPAAPPVPIDWPDEPPCRGGVAVGFGVLLIFAGLFASAGTEDPAALILFAAGVNLIAMGLAFGYLGRIEWYLKKIFENTLDKNK